MYSGCSIWCDRARRADRGAAADPHERGPELSKTINLGLHLLDRQLLDSEDRRCGNVDDLAGEGGPGEKLEVAAIFSGPRVWRWRAGLIGRFAAWIGGGSVVRTPWE